MTLPTPEELKSVLKSRREKIPIGDVIELSYRTPDFQYRFKALVASTEFTEEKGRNMLVYLENGSQHGMLHLIDIRRETPSGFESVDTLGFYDRDEQRKISAIYLPIEGVFPSAFQGTLDDLLRYPNVVRK